MSGQFLINSVRRKCWVLPYGLIYINGSWNGLSVGLCNKRSLLHSWLLFPQFPVKQKTIQKTVFELILFLDRCHTVWHTLYLKEMAISYLCKWTWCDVCGLLQQMCDLIPRALSLTRQLQHWRWLQLPFIISCTGQVLWSMFTLQLRHLPTFPFFFISTYLSVLSERPPALISVLVLENINYLWVGWQQHSTCWVA